MKIILLGSAHPIRPGGITTFNERLCRAFIEAGHDASIWSFSLQYPGFLFPGTSQFANTPPPKELRILSIVNSINPFNWIKIGIRLKNEKPDLVVVRYWIPFMGPCLGTILRFAKKNQHTRVVCIADNIVPHEKRPGDKWFTQYFVKPVDAFVVMSQQVLNDLKKFTTKPAIFQPHPLYDNFGAQIPIAEARKHLSEVHGINLSDNDQVLVFFGLVRQYKGLDLLISAMKTSKNQQVKLLVAGEFYEPMLPYTDQVAALQLHDRVLLHPHFISDEEVKYFICAADCIIQPYRHATQSGVTPVAYHFEIPMIVTNVGGLPEMVPHGRVGLVAEPNPASLSATIDEYFRLGKTHFLPNLLQEKKKLSWQSMVETITSGQW